MSYENFDYEKFVAYVRGKSLHNVFQIVLKRARTIVFDDFVTFYYSQVMRRLITKFDSKIRATLDVKSIVDVLEEICPDITDEVYEVVCVEYENWRNR